jgi:hypothetical protein
MNIQVSISSLSIDHPIYALLNNCNVDKDYITTVFWGGLGDLRYI